MSETSQRKDSIKGSNPVSSTTNQGDGSKHDDSSRSPEPTGNGPRHTADATSDKGLSLSPWKRSAGDWENRTWSTKIENSVSSSSNQKAEGEIAK